MPFQAILLLQPVRSQTERQHSRAGRGEKKEPRPCLLVSSTAEFGVLSGCAMLCTCASSDKTRSTMLPLQNAGAFSSFFKSRLTIYQFEQRFVRARRLDRFRCSNLFVAAECQHSRAGRGEKKEPRPCLPVSSAAEFRFCRRSRAPSFICFF